MIHVSLTLGLLVASCSKPAPMPTATTTSPVDAAVPIDDCWRTYEKSKDVVVEFSEPFGREMKVKPKDSFLAKCRDELAAGHRSPVVECVLAATTAAAIEACWNG